MENIEGRARAVLVNAEREIQRLLEEAVRSRQYDALSSVGAWATGLSTLLNGHRVIQGGDDADTVVALSEPKAPVTADVKPQKQDRESYPQFWRDGNSLVKVGWSPANRATYQHKAERRVLDAIAEVISTVASKRRRFQVSDLEKAYAASGAPAAPNYQFYVALAWLRWSGLITQHGRQGYSLPAPTRFRDDVKAAWTQLASR